MNTVATLSNDKCFTSFTYNGTRIRFAAPVCLEKYTKILEWDNGYLLCIEPSEFLKNIKEVNISYD